MKCRCCNKKLQSDFVYCPYCGEGVRRRVNPFNIIGNLFKRELNSPEDLFNMQKDMQKEIDEFGSFSSKERGVEEFTQKIPGGVIKIRKMSMTKPGDERYVSRQPNEPIKLETKQLPKKRELKPVSKNFIEPEFSFKRRANRIFVEVLLPGIKSMDEIQLTQLEESVELRAFGKNKTYFKIIKLPLSSKVVNTKFENEKLILTLM